MLSLPLENAQNNAISGTLSRGGSPTWVGPTDPTATDLLIVTVGWNVVDLLLDNLRTLQHSVGAFSARVVVVDNASHDQTVERVQAECPWVTVIANTENRGFAAACNQGMLAGRSRHVLLLNPDMRVEPDALARLIDYADTHPDVGVISGKLTHEDGSLIQSVRRFPDFISQFVIMSQLEKVFPSLTKRYHARDLDLYQEQAVDSVRGSLFLLTERAMRVLGGLDERYFIWFEEVDYCRRAKLHGLKVMHVPAVRAFDAIGRSFAQRDVFWKQQQFTRSMVTYFTLWAPWWQSNVLRSFRLINLTAAWLVVRLKRV